MSHPLDYRSLGFLVLQDHDQNADLAGRQFMAAVRVLRGPDDASSPFADVKGTYGEVLGGLFLKSRDERRKFIHGWWLTPASVISTAPSGSGEQITDQLATVAPGDESAVSGWLPQRSAGVADERFEAFGTKARHPILDDQLFPGGWTGWIGAGTEERRQEEILHLDFIGLVAPHRNGPGRAGTPVFDLDAEGNLDPARYARLQALARVAVVPPRQGSAPGVQGALGRLLAWQMGEARDGNLTGGLVADRAGAAAVAFPPSGDDADPLAGDELDAPDDDELRVGGVTFFGPRPRSLGDGTQTGGDVVIFDGLGETRERERTETEDDPDAPLATIVPGQEILACASHWMGGLLDVGAVGDVHELGRTIDGEPINSAHISADVPHRSNDGFWDVGLEYRREFFEPTERGQMLVPVYFRVDPGQSHTTATGTFPGLGRWEAESAIGWLPPDPPPGRNGPPIPGPLPDPFPEPVADNPRIPGGAFLPRSPTGGLPGGGFGIPGGGGLGVPGPADGLPGSGGLDGPFLDPRTGEPLDSTGRPLRIPGFRATNASELHGLSYSLSALAAPSFAFRPQQRADGSPDFRRAGVVSGEALAAYNARAPVVGSLMSFAEEKGNEFVYGDTPGGAGRWRGGDANGVTMFMPSDVDEAVASSATSARAQTVGVHRQLTWGHGQVSSGGSAIVNGWRETIDSSNNKVVTPVDSTGATRTAVQWETISGWKARNSDGSKFAVFAPEPADDVFKVSGVAQVRFITTEVNCSNDLATVRLMGQLGENLTIISRYGFAGSAPRISITAAAAGGGSGGAGGDIVLTPGNGDGAGAAGRVLY